MIDYKEEFYTLAEKVEEIADKLAAGTYNKQDGYNELYDALDLYYRLVCENPTGTFTDAN